MEKFNFYQDYKQTVWGRNYFTVKADSLEEATEIVKENAIYNDVVEVEDAIIKFNYAEILCDTYDKMSVEENNATTLETYTEDGELLGENGDDYIGFLIGQRFDTIQGIVTCIKTFNSSVKTVESTYKGEDNCDNNGYKSDFMFDIMLNDGEFNYTVYYLRDNSGRMVITEVAQY